MQFIKKPKITDPKGYTAAAIRAGFKRKRRDLCVIKSAVPALVSAKFTRNAVKAAPLIAAQQSLQRSKNRAQALVVNSGCANAGTGEQGLRDVAETVSRLSDEIEVPADLILPASTGVIGELLDMDKMRAGIKELGGRMTVPGGAACAEAILTTDKVEKSFGMTIDIAGVTVTMSGITKGSGMIQPNVATTLAFVTTDAVIEHQLLDEIFTDCVNLSYNMITVDGHMSTNDTVLIMANGQAENPIIREGTTEAVQFRSAIRALLLNMAKSIVRDGEGASKFVTVAVNMVDSVENAKKMAFGIANSALVKTAIFGQDPNWGRILSGAGMVGVAFDPDAANLHINGTTIFNKGNPLPICREKLDCLMIPREIDIVLEINNGFESAVVYTSDLTFDYIKINAEYHT